MAVRLQLRRGKYAQGYLVVAVRTGGPSTLDYAGIDARTRDDVGRRALVSIAGQDLLIGVEDGWLKAWWRPLGFMIFPGRFSEEKWRQVLDAMHAVATSLEAARIGPQPGKRGGLVMVSMPMALLDVETRSSTLVANVVRTRREKIIAGTQAR